MLITPACYAHLLSSLLSLAGGKVAVILEVDIFLNYVYLYFYLYIIAIINNSNFCN